MFNLDIVIMAAGHGTRMKSSKPKVLHTLAGMPMLQRLLNTVQTLKPRQITVITGFGAAQVQSQIKTVGANTQYVLQEPQLGTGHAVLQAVPLLPDDGITVILNGDGPLIEAATIEKLIDACAEKSLAILTICLDNPYGYGRILRGVGQAGVVGIVEEKDASSEERKIKEVNTGVMAVPTTMLKRWVGNLNSNNAQQEYYLTDIVGMAVADDVAVTGVEIDDAVQVAGVNNPAQLAALERAYQLRVAHELLEAGVRLADPARLDVRGTLNCGTDVEIDVGCIFEGTVQVGSNVSIGAYCVLRHVEIADGVKILPFTHIDGGTDGGANGERLGVQIGENASIGPFTRLRPGTKLGQDSHVGNFVEVKNSTLGQGAKAGHLSYIGDTSVGEKANIGAGTITANYDGVNKYKTVIGAHTRVGSNTVLVAPVELGARSTTAAGSAITADVPANGLGIGRARQVNMANWKRPEKKAD